MIKNGLPLLDIYPTFTLKILGIGILDAIWHYSTPDIY
jgi:hypothetical protein